jgi:hypothetical protein
MACLVERVTRRLSVFETSSLGPDSDLKNEKAFITLSLLSDPLFSLQVLTDFWQVDGTVSISGVISNAALTMLR